MASATDIASMSTRLLVKATEGELALSMLGV